MEKSQNSLNLTLLGFFVCGAWSKHLPQVVGEAGAARQRDHGGARLTESPGVAPSPSYPGDAQGLVGENRYDLMLRRARLVGQPALSSKGSEHIVQPGAVLSRRFKEWHILTEDASHL